MLDKIEEKYTVPNPGSLAAQELGCTCPVLDNNFGRGSDYGENIFICTAGCPVHPLFTDLYIDNIPHS